MKAILEKLDNASARMERVILLAGAIASAAPLPDDLREFLGYEDEKTISAVLGDVPEAVDLDDEDGVVEWLANAGKLGYMVQFATPVMEARSNGMTSGNWGHYATQWVYGDTMEQAVETGLAWVETVRAREQEEAKKGGSA